MVIFRQFETLLKHLCYLKKTTNGLGFGFVPTMGALHEGHLSLIRASRRECGVTICSIFVNPAQFGDSNDLEEYPKPIEQDIELLVKNACDILFLPSVEEVYPVDYVNQCYDLNGLDLRFEGKSRPGHFQGVCNVIYRFLSLIKPDFAYFGQKDYQQTVVIKRLTEVAQLNTIIRVVPIVRESNGLAMSSRNVRLSASGRNKASFILEGLEILQKNFRVQGISKAIDLVSWHIASFEGAELDYLILADSTSLKEIRDEEHTDLVALIAVNYEGVHLLDNMILSQ
ncbi:pantoate--beta-alanine ligase [Bacteroidia bacterium]|nr:pantoate--beta-alanine ligase [Bacteroidia bacterium]